MSGGKWLFFVSTVLFNSIYLADILFQIPDTFQFLHKGDRCPQQGKRLDVSKTTTASNTWTDSDAMAHNGGVSILMSVYLYGVQSYDIVDSIWQKAIFHVINTVIQFDLTFNAGVPFLIFDGSGTNKWGITKSSNHAIGMTESKQKRYLVHLYSLV